MLNPVIIIIFLIQSKGSFYCREALRDLVTALKNILIKKKYFHLKYCFAQKRCNHLKKIKIIVIILLNLLTQRSSLARHPQSELIGIFFLEIYDSTNWLKELMVNSVMINNLVEFLNFIWRIIYGRCALRNVVTAPKFKFQK